MRPTGTRKSTSRRLFARAPESSIQASAIGRLGRSTRAVSSRARAVGDRGSDSTRRGRPLGDHVPPVATAARAEIDHVVGGADGLRVVLDDEHRGAHVGELPQVRQEAARVARVQADGRLVEHVEGAGQAAAELRAEAQPLHLAPRERVRGAVEGEVAEADLLRRTPAVAGAPRAAPSRSSASLPSKRHVLTRASALATERAVVCAYVSPNMRTPRGTALRREPGARRRTSRRVPRTPRCVAGPPSTPVPSHASQRPCLVLNENHRGSSSGTPVPQLRARAVRREHLLRVGGARRRPGRTRRPRARAPSPHASARSNVARSRSASLP